MSPVLLETIGPFLTATLYVAATVALLRSFTSNSRSGRNIALGITAVASVFHAVLQFQTWMNHPLDQITVVAALSLCSLAVVALWASTLARPNPVFESGLFALPIAAVANLLDGLVPGPPIDLGTGLGSAAPSTVIHVMSSILAFGMLSLAGVYALLVLAVDHSLKRHELSKLIQNLPPLDRLEDLLFKLIATGFALLTIALVTGLLYVENLMAQHLVHKTVLAFVAWFIFGSLLLGRWVKGWRGALAVRLTLAGIALLLLSYFGSKLVLEVILGRSWYSP